VTGKVKKREMAQLDLWSDVTSVARISAVQGHQRKSFTRSSFGHSITRQSTMPFSKQRRDNEYQCDNDYPDRIPQESLSCATK